MSVATLNNLFPYPRNLEINENKQFKIGWSGITIPTMFEQRMDESHCNYAVQESMPKHGYTLKISAGKISISAADEHGFLYAHLTLKQIEKIYSDSCPDLDISDFPDFEKRGIILDVSRDKIPTMDSLFELIDLWHKLRINQLQLYTEHTFAYSNHKTVWDGYSPITADEIKTIDTYCRERGIELIPNQATFGHMEKWLCHDEYKHLAEQTTGFIDQRGDMREGSFGVNPVSQDVEVLISELFAELLLNFTSNTLNINFDETMDLGFDKSKVACEELGKGQVYLEYLQKVVNLAENKGKNCQIFSDMILQFPEILKDLPEGVELLNWGYEEDHPYDKEHEQLAKTGLPFQVVVSTDTFASVAGRLTTAKIHMQRAAISAKKYGAIGYQISEWGDMGHPQTFSMPIPAYIYGAAMAWNAEQHPQLDLKVWLKELLPRENTEVISKLLQIQDCYRNSGVITPNCAFYGPFVFDQISKRHIKRATIESEVRLLESIKELEEHKHEIFEYHATPLKTELTWTIDVMLLASEIAIQFECHSTRDLQELPLESKSILMKKLSLVEEPYFEVWQDKFREGGAKQSYNRLVVLREQLL